MWQVIFNVAKEQTALTQVIPGLVGDALDVPGELLHSVRDLAVLIPIEELQVQVFGLPRKELRSLLALVVSAIALQVSNRIAFSQISGGFAGLRTNRIRCKRALERIDMRLRRLGYHVQALHRADAVFRGLLPRCPDSPKSPLGQPGSDGSSQALPFIKRLARS